MLTICTVNANAQNFFWSQADLDGNVAESDLTIAAEVGDAGTAFLYYSPNGQNIQDGMDVDFSWSSSGAVGFTAATTFDFNVTIQSQSIGMRWGDFAGSALAVTQDAVEGFFAKNVVSGQGIVAEYSANGGGPFLDEGSVGDFFQIGSIEWEALSSGSANLVIDNALVSDGIDIGATFSNLTISVGVPEPVTSGILVLSIVGCLIRRKR